MNRRKQGIERRRWQRLPVGFPVFVRGTDTRGKQFLDFTNILNISSGGALLATRVTLSRSASVSLEIPSAPLPQFGPLPDHVRAIQARVMRATHLEACSLYGLRFRRQLA
jgi:hypothetical protein